MHIIQNIDLKNMDRKKKIVLGLVILVVLLAIIFVFYKKYNAKTMINQEQDIGQNLENKNPNLDYVSPEDYTKYDGQVSNKAKAESKLSFSFFHKKDLEIKQGQGRTNGWFQILEKENSKSKNPTKNFVTIYFISENQSKWTVDNYIKNILNPNNLLEVSAIKFADENATSSSKYLLDKKTNTEYFVKSLKDNAEQSWLMIIENLRADNPSDQQISQDIIRSFEVR